jgi:hypothetical protein
MTDPAADSAPKPRDEEEELVAQLVSEAWDRIARGDETR